MKRIAFTFAGALAVLLLGALVPVLSQDMGDKEEPAPADPMAEMRKLHMPGEQHKWLAEDVGEWEISGTMFGPDGKAMVLPDGTAMTIKGKSTIKMLYDRYLYEEMTMGEGESVMKGFGYLGYDNSNKEFQAMYCMDWTTGMRVYSGQRDEKAGTLSLSAEWVEKGMNNAKIKERVVGTRISKDEAKMEMYRSMGGEPEKKDFEMTYKRKK